MRQCAVLSTSADVRGARCVQARGKLLGKFMDQPPVAAEGLRYSSQMNMGPSYEGSLAPCSLTVPNTLGVEYNAHVLESILTHVAPALGWR